MTTYHNEIRLLLAQHPDGLSTTTLCSMLGKSERAMLRVMRRMVDVYVDRWAEPNRGQYTAVWMLHTVPEDCPHPLRPRRIETTWRN